jgi:hypothetical protein
MKKSARQIFDRALPWGTATKPLRTRAYTCLGLWERLKADTDDRNLTLNLQRVATSLVEEHEENSTEGWDWFEGTLTYDNARLCQALFAAYEALGEEKFLVTAEKSLIFLLGATTREEMHTPIGNDGWYSRGEEVALYDQQPVDAGAALETTALAYKVTKNMRYERAMRQALGWFFGLNTKSIAIYDPATGACYDGITAKGLNENQGSESTVSFLLGAAAMIGNLG